ncbi:hypothetical protein ACQKII_07585 [Lysinibacillus sp. NPDC048646]|uniref:hypothetical protein n=1 Tax=Lysinibacillus sp. NPDC048646 TaxID=3390574 RepID=UPI003D02C206
MKRISPKRFELAMRDFSSLGDTVEYFLEWIKQGEYANYAMIHFPLEGQLALRIIEGMDDWQCQHSKGVRFKLDGIEFVEIYDKKEHQNEIDRLLEASVKINY